MIVKIERASGGKVFFSIFCIFFLIILFFLKSDWFSLNLFLDIK